MSYDLIELTLCRLGEQLPERLSPCVESHQTSGRSDKIRTGISRQSEEACPVLRVYTAEGPRSVDERDIRQVCMGDNLGRYCLITAVLADGKEITGLMLAEAFKPLGTRLRAAA
jgi:hypothetical protein